MVETWQKNNRAKKDGEKAKKHKRKKKGQNPFLVKMR